MSPLGFLPNCQTTAYFEKADDPQTFRLTHSTAPSPAFEDGVKKRGSGSTLSPRPELGPKASPGLQAGESKG